MADWLIVLIGGIIGALPGIYAIIAGRRKTRAETEKLHAEAAEIVSESAMRLIDPLRKQVLVLEARIAKVETENIALCKQIEEFRNLIRALWEGVIVLSRQIELAGHSPVWDLENYRQFVERALKVK